MRFARSWAGRGFCPRRNEMSAFVDLHIHSCLSPCAQDDMTPWNLVGMARVKGLRVVAITDHNTAKNAPAAMAAGEEYGVSVIPGMEITSREEVHILGYFPAVENALAAGEEVYAHLAGVRNRPALFGNQILVNLDDEPCGTLDKLLIGATDLTVDAVRALVAAHGGVSVPAHINRGSNGMLGALGFMPPLPVFPVAEVYRGAPCPAHATQGRFVLHSSDAHRLEDISEADFLLEVPPKASEVLALFRALGA